MRLIGEIDDRRNADRFAAYLITLGIPAKAEATAGEKAEIWVHEEDQFKPAQIELAEFVASPNDPKYSQALSQSQRILREHEEKHKRIQKKIIVGKRKLEPKPQLTIILIAISVLVGLFTDFGRVKKSEIFRALAFTSVPPPQSIEILERAKGNPDDLSLRLASLKRGEIWRAITPIFIHHGAMHLLFNMIWLFKLGKLIELRYGKTYFLVLVVTSAAISNLIQCMVPIRWDGVSPGLTADLTLLAGLGGFSGVVYALFGLVWVKSVIDPRSRFVISQSTVAIMLVWLVFCMLPGPEGNSLTEHLFGFRVANWAHAIGLAVGIAVAFFPDWRTKKFLPS